MEDSHQSEPTIPAISDCLLRSAGALSVERSEADRADREREREAVVALFRLFDSTSDLHTFMGAVAHFLAEWAGFDATGIRLREGEDYPYIEVVGFPKRFVRAENSLCAHKEGNVLRDKNGAVVLECMCGNVICGRTDAAKPFYTQAGSFWTNGTTELLRSTAEADRGAHTRNRCNEEGYESVGLFPIRLRGETFGILQMNDRRPDRFSLTTVQMFERIAESLALALAHRRAEAELEVARREQEAMHEQLVLRTAEAETANRAKDIFLAMLSHELRSPLNVIALNLHVIETSRGDAARVQRSVRAIDRAVQGQTQLIEELLDVSRIVSGKLKLDLQPVDVAARMRATVDGLRPQAEAKSIELQMQIDDGVSLVRGDPARVQQVLWNLVANAIKFTPNGGRIDVRLEKNDPGTGARIRVADTGRGIPPEFLSHIFEPFVQEDSSTTRAYGGLGLGLAIVSHLVDAHHGTIKAESPGLGEGATFIVTLPSADETPVVSISSLFARGLDTPLRGLRVLIVDDDRESREALGELVSDAGARVRLASSAAEAMSAVEAFEPDMMLCDVAMPVEDGCSLLRRIKAVDSPAFVRLRAIAVTALAAPVDRERTASAGFAAHVAKPVDIERLIRTVARLSRE